MRRGFPQKNKYNDKSIRKTSAEKKARGASAVSSLSNPGSALGHGRSLSILDGESDVQWEKRRGLRRNWLFSEYKH